MKKNFFSVVLLLTVTISVGYGYKTYTKPPVIKTKTIELSYGEKFDLKRIKTEENVSSKKVIKGKVNSKKLGKQQIIIQVKNKRNVTAKAKVTVNVIDKKAPIIEAGDEIEIEVKKEFNILNAVKVMDNEDKEIQTKIKYTPYSTNEIGEQKVKLEVMDRSNNKSEKTVTLKVTDSTPPIITAKDRYMTEGQSIDLLYGVKAEDYLDGDISKNIKLEGNVDTNKADTYKITYKVKDKSNNEATKTINVTVKKKETYVVERVISSKDTSNNSSIFQSSKKYQPMMLYFNGKAIPYKNGGKSSGQRIINSGRVASTWGGAAVFSGTDGMNTHFIGHNPGVFSGIQNASSFIITDGKGNAYTYRVTRIYRVNDRAIGINDGVNYWGRITGIGGGERVTFQTCQNSSINWIIEASIR